MPYRSELLSKIFLEKQKDINELYEKIDNQCIIGEFDLLTNKSTNTKTNFYELILTNIKTSKKK